MMKKIFPVFISVLMIFLSACGPEVIIFNPESDVFVITKKVETNSQVDTLYGLALHVFANKPLTTAKASPSDGSGTSFNLMAYNNNSYDFYYQTPDDEFSTTKPYIGNYSFDIVDQEGETSKMNDDLIDDFMYPTDTLYEVYDSSAQTTTLNWDKIKDADYMTLKMFDQDKNLVFGSPNTLYGSSTKYTVSATTGWVNGTSPTAGTTYTVELDAFMFEPGQTGVNLQTKSITFKDFVWGE